MPKPQSSPGNCRRILLAQCALHVAWRGVNKYRVLTKPGLYIVDAAGLASKDATSDDGSAAEGYEPVRPLRFDALQRQQPPRQDASHALNQPKHAVANLWCSAVHRQKKGCSLCFCGSWELGGGGRRMTQRQNRSSMGERGVACVGPAGNMKAAPNQYHLKPAPSFSCMVGSHLIRMS